MAIGKFNKNIQDDMGLIEKSNDITRIIDEYANGGFEIISRKLDKDPDYFLYMGPEELEEDAVPKQQFFRFKL